MIEISFAKLLVVMIIGLIVVGPRRLPKLAHFVGRCVGKMRLLARSVTTDLSEESPVQKEIKKIEQDINPHG